MQHRWCRCKRQTAAGGAARKHKKALVWARRTMARTRTCCVSASARCRHSRARPGQSDEQPRLQANGQPTQPLRQGKALRAQRRQNMFSLRRIQSAGKTDVLIGPKTKLFILLWVQTADHKPRASAEIYPVWGNPWQATSQGLTGRAVWKAGTLALGTPEHLQSHGASATSSGGGGAHAYAFAGLQTLASDHPGATRRGPGNASVAKPSRSPAQGTMHTLATAASLQALSSPRPSCSPVPAVDLVIAVMQEREAVLEVLLTNAGAQAKRTPAKTRSMSPAPAASRLTSPTQAAARGQRGDPRGCGTPVRLGDRPLAGGLQKETAPYRGASAAPRWPRRWPRQDMQSRHATLLCRTSRWVRWQIACCARWTQISDPRPSPFERS